jgi:hypothetical protein
MTGETKPGWVVRVLRFKEEKYEEAFMRKNRRFPAGICCLLPALACALFAGCPMEATNDIERIDVVLSDVFVIGAKAVSGSNHGWLAAEDQEDGSINWVKKISDLDPGLDAGYDGVRLFNIDRDLGVRDGVFDAGPYDGIVFKYRTNVYNTEFRFRDFSFWFAWWANEDTFPAWDWEAGSAKSNAGCPDADYKEVVLPFYKMGRWGIQQSTGREDNDLTNFDPNQLSNVHIDGRSTMPDSGGIWLEIVDFAFFIYK